MRVQFSEWGEFLSELIAEAAGIDGSIVRCRIVTEDPDETTHHFYLQAGFLIDDELRDYLGLIGTDYGGRPPVAAEAVGQLREQLKRICGEQNLQLRGGYFEE